MFFEISSGDTVLSVSVVPAQAPILASDIDEAMTALTAQNAALAGVKHCLHIQTAPVSAFSPGLAG